MLFTIKGRVFIKLDLLSAYGMVVEFLKINYIFVYVSLKVLGTCQVQVMTLKKKMVSISIEYDLARFSRNKGDAIGRKNVNFMKLDKNSNFLKKRNRKLSQYENYLAYQKKLCWAIKKKQFKNQAYVKIHMKKTNSFKKIVYKLLSKSFSNKGNDNILVLFSVNLNDKCFEQKYWFASSILWENVKYFVFLLVWMIGVITFCIFRNVICKENWSLGMFTTQADVSTSK